MKSRNTEKYTWEVTEIYSHMVDYSMALGYEEGFVFRECLSACL